MRIPFAVGLVFIVLYISYKTSERYNVIGYTSKFISEKLGVSQNSGNSSSFFDLKFRLPEALRNIISELEGGDAAENGTVVLLTSEDFKTTVVKVENGTIVKEKLKTALQDVCECYEGNCACCVIVDIPDFSHSVCVNATYNPKLFGLDLAIGFDGHYFMQDISLRNPPPFCFSLPIPGAEPEMCVAFKNMNVDQKAQVLTGCIELDIDFFHLKLTNIDLGCFKMPI
ncbi:hypothetical protein CRE_29507 [Caenorhabditis remanei]|uniref:DUF4773 domain-containing protein n=1 Tax=Caenorhabditis remanei TaxID=31234 RepID=E3LVE8_CAERE|nr:hypothetical protein CRE_29507 [Caenorhabditis remanei]